MWCPLCHSDVAAEFSADDRRLLCARCGEVLAVSPVPRRSLPLTATTTAMDAAALLARWSAEETLLEPRTELNTPLALLHEDDRSPEMMSTGLSDTPPSSGIELAASDLPSAGLESGSRLPPFSSITPVVPAVERPLRIAPVAGLPAKEGEEAVPPRRRQQRQHPPAEPTNWVFVAGQMAAYCGVFVLTCGTAMVVTSLAKGETQETQSGWLLATIGQMLLFLGVVTIISSGLEQTRSEFRRELRRLRKTIAQLRAAPSTPNPRRNRPAA